MKVIVKLSVITLMLLSTAACSWLFGDDGVFRDRGNDYRNAKAESALAFPEGIDSEAIDDSYAIPQISDRTSLTDEFVVPRPEPLAGEMDRDSVRINTLDRTRWILVDGTPGQVWPRLRGFLSLNQLGVQRADATSGILETGWLQPSGEKLLRERYRLRIDQGVQRGTSEVYVLQSDIRAGQDQWPEYSSNTEREEIMVQELAQFLADSAAAAAVSMLAQQALDSSGRVTIEEDDNALPFLNLQLPFTRAWASVGKALEKAGYTVDDLNRDQRLYYLHYADRSHEEEEKGFFRSLFGSSDDDNAQGIAYLLHVKEHGPQSVVVSIQRQDSENMVQGEAEKLLKLIKRHLS